MAELRWQVIPGQQPIPGFKPVFRLGTTLAYSPAAPNLGGCMPLQILMGPDMVVPEPEEVQGSGKLIPVFYCPTIQCML